MAQNIKTTLLSPKQIQDIKNGDSLNCYRAQSIDDHYCNYRDQQSSEDQNAFRQKKRRPKKNYSYSNNVSVSSIKPRITGALKRKAYNPVKVNTLENVNDIEAKETDENRSHSNEGSASGIKPRNTRSSKQNAGDPVKEIMLEDSNTTRKKAITPDIVYDSTGRKLYLSSYTKKEISTAHALILLRYRPVNTLEEIFKRKNKYNKEKQRSCDTECTESPSSSSSSSISLNTEGKCWGCRKIIWNNNSETVDHPISISSSSSSTETISDEEF